MITLNYNIIDMKVIGENDIVKSVDIEVVFTNDSGKKHSYTNNVILDDPSTSFISFQELTKEQVSTWCESKMFQGPESKNLVLEQVENMFANQETSKIPTSWSN